jgi:hypothetical protein
MEGVARWRTIRPSLEQRLLKATVGQRTSMNMSWHDVAGQPHGAFFAQ